jgi:hypothetical protein
LEVDSTDPIACAKAVPAIAVRERTNRPSWESAIKMRRGTLCQQLGSSTATPL